MTIFVLAVCMTLGVGIMGLGIVGIIGPKSPNGIECFWTRCNRLAVLKVYTYSYIIKTTNFKSGYVE